jgi:hypothetical protein
MKTFSGSEWSESALHYSRSLCGTRLRTRRRASMYDSGCIGASIHFPCAIQFGPNVIPLHRSTGELS